MRTGVAALAVFACVPLLVSACGTGGSSAKAAAAPARAGCPSAWKAGWQQLANRIHASVYCPGWVPPPISDARIGGQWNNIDSVSRDRSYLISFVWQETGSGEVHVNFRGYPGRTAIPTCPGDTGPTPCFSDPHGQVRENGIAATMYTVNQGADQWHVLLAWRRGGSLYTLSQHVAPPNDYRRVVADLHRMLRDVTLVDPGAS